MPLRTGRKLRPVQCLGLHPRETEEEVSGKPVAIAFDLFVQPLCGHSLERSQFGIEDDSSTTQNDDGFNNLRGGFGRQMR